jgi:para-aminobenzoate synthetase
MRALLVDNYDSYTYNLYQLLASVNGEEPVVVLNDQVRAEDLDGILDRERIDCIVVSPGPGTPDNARDAGIALDVFSRYRDVPILGVCFGFQCLCRVHGGAAIVRAPEPVHGRTSAVSHAGDPLFRGIPSGQDYHVVRYHSLCVDTATLDAEAVVPLAWTGVPGDPDRVLMAARHVEYPHYGVQFHPESICTAYGRELLENFRDLALTAGGALNASRPRPDPLLPFPASPSADTPPRRISRQIDAVVETLEGCVDSIRGGTARMVEELFVRPHSEAHTQDVFFLDSALPERTRFSYMGGMGGPLWRRVSYALHERGEGGTLTVEDHTGASSAAECPSVFDWITEQTAAFSAFGERFASLPFEFWGGAVGYLGYELKSQTGGRRAHHSAACDACFFLVDRFVCVDHEHGDVYVVAVYDAEGPGREASEAWARGVADACRGMMADVALGAAPRETPGRLPALSDFSERHSRTEYVSKVIQCQAFLHAGDSYELCLTNMLRLPRADGDADPWSFYKRLRRRNPAPYASFMDFSAVGCGETTEPLGRRAPPGPVLCCSSPERFLRGTRAGALEAKPIKGTARRDLGDKHRDAAAARRLAASEKDRAENLMIVDLLRNDLGRVSETGSVRVPGLMRIESFATVHQMVSTIVGQKKATIGTGEVIRAAFPGGSMTGAPKIRSMEILDAIEEGPRGPYSGSLGFISWNGAFDLNIVIRTAIFNPDEILVGAGGAIVVQSDPQGEYDEMKLKFDTLCVE